MAKELNCAKLVEYVEALEDPRSTTNRRHPLVNIIFISICAAISGATKWTEVETFGKEREEWLSKYLDMSNGVPSHDTIGRVFRLLRPETFSQIFHEWIEVAMGPPCPDVVAIDGKTDRRTGDSSLGKSALHMVTAWATEDQVVLGQVKTEDKSNEITAIPLLLDELDLEGVTVTVDAMGCQRAIAEKILEGNGDYVFGLKGNQSGLLEHAKELFTEVEEAGEDFADVQKDQHTSNEKDHGRVERREYAVLEDSTLPGTQGAWPGLRSFVRVISERTEKDQTTREIRYYATSLPCNARELAKAVRKHWSIENSLHWCLDMSFRSDESRIRKDHAPENLAVLVRMTHSLLKNERTDKRGIVGKRFRAALSPAYMEKVLCRPRG